MEYEPHEVVEFHGRDRKHNGVIVEEHGDGVYKIQLPEYDKPLEYEMDGVRIAGQSAYVDESELISLGTPIKSLKSDNFDVDEHMKNLSDEVGANVTTIQLKQSTKDQLEARKLGSESFDDVVRTLLGGGSGELWTRTEIREIARAEVDREFEKHISGDEDRKPCGEYHPLPCGVDVDCPETDG